jgi:hypothetical protein
MVSIPALERPSYASFRSTTCRIIFRVIPQPRLLEYAGAVGLIALS